MNHTVRLDQDVCLSSGRCVADFPRAFAFDDHEIARTTEHADELSVEEMLTAARNCPSGAIRVFDAQGAEVDPW